MGRIVHINASVFEYNVYLLFHFLNLIAGAQFCGSRIWAGDERLENKFI